MAAGEMFASPRASCTSTSREWTPVKCCSINSLLTRSGASCFNDRTMSVPSVICPIPGTMTSSSSPQTGNTCHALPGTPPRPGHHDEQQQPTDRKHLAPMPGAPSSQPAQPVLQAPGLEVPEACG